MLLQQLKMVQVCSFSATQKQKNNFAFRVLWTTLSTTKNSVILLFVLHQQLKMAPTILLLFLQQKIKKIVLHQQLKFVPTFLGVPSCSFRLTSTKTIARQHVWYVEFHSVPMVLKLRRICEKFLFLYLQSYWRKVVWLYFWMDYVFLQSFHYFITILTSWYLSFWWIPIPLITRFSELKKLRRGHSK